MSDLRFVLRQLWKSPGEEIGVVSIHFNIYEAGTRRSQWR